MKTNPITRSFRAALILTLAWATSASSDARSVGPTGINAPPELTGAGVAIGQVEDGRPRMPGLDALLWIHADVSPTAVFEVDQPPTADSGWIDESNHAEAVAGVMISSDGLPGGGGHRSVAPNAELYSSTDWPVPHPALPVDPFARLGLLYNWTVLSLQHVARQHGGAVRAINLSWGLEELGVTHTGVTLVSLGVDWLAGVHDVLYVSGSDQVGALVPSTPQDAFNRLNVGRTRIDQAGVYRIVSPFSVLVQTIDGRVLTDLVAPGDDITVPWVVFKPGQHNVGDRHIVASGTSFAAPHVTGTVALLQQRAENRIATGRPEWNANARRHQVMKAVLMNSADKIRDTGDGLFLGMEKTILRTDGHETDNWLSTDAYHDVTKPLDIQLGVGQLNATRALLQFEGGQASPVPPDNVIRPRGWDWNHTSGAGQVRKYVFGKPLQGQSFVSITLVWDRLVALNTDTNGNGAYDAGDTFRVERLTNMDVYLMPKGATALTQFVTGCASQSNNYSVEHIFCRLPTQEESGQSGEYEIWVVQKDNPAPGGRQDYALAWWAMAKRQTRVAKLDTVFVIDATISMGGSLAGVRLGVDAYISAAEAAAQSDGSEPPLRYALVLFGSAPELVLDFTDDAAALRQAIASIDLHGEVAGFQLDHNHNPEGGLEAVRMALGMSQETLAHDNVGGDGILHFRTDALRHVVVATDENSDRPFFASNREPGQDSLEPPADLTGTGWQQEVDRTARAVNGSAAIVSMMVNPDDSPSNAQYGDPGAEVFDPGRGTLDAGATLDRLVARGAGASLQAQVLRSGTAVRLFDINTIDQPGAAARFMEGGLAEIEQLAPETAATGSIGVAADGFGQQGSMLSYDVAWVNGTVTTPLVTMAATLPAELEAISVRTSPRLGFSLENGEVVVDAAALEAGAIARAKIRGRIAGAAADGTSLDGSARYVDQSGAEQVDAVGVTVDPDPASLRLRLRGSGKKTVLDGQRVSYRAKYRNALADNVFALRVPPQIEVTRATPTPSETADNVIVWRNLRAGSGSVRVDGTVVLPAAVAATIMKIDASMTDERTVSRSILTPARQRTEADGSAGTQSRALVVYLTGSSFVRTGLLQQISASYRYLSGNGVLRLVLAPEYQVQQIFPTGGVEDPPGTITWNGLSSASGSVKVKALLAETAPAGAVLESEAVVTSATQTATDTLKQTVR